MKQEIRIVIVDDCRTDRELFSELLEAQGYKAWVGASGTEGLRLAREIRPHLILLDVGLPGMNGTEVCRQIKADKSLADVFVILFSGHSVTAIHQIDGLESGADDYLLKGTDTATFLARIKTALRLQETTSALRASEEKFRELAENIHEVFWMVNSTADKFLYVSPAYEAIWGRPRETLYDDPFSWIQSVHPSDRDRIVQAMPAKQISQEHEAEFRIIQPDGTIVWIRNRAFPIRDSLGNVCRIAGIAEDITKQKKVEGALHESESRQRAIREAALDGIITFDQSGKIIEMNLAAEKMIGCGRGRAIGSDICRVLLPPSLREWFQRGLDHGFTVDEAPILGGRVEILALRADGTQFPAECAITRIDLVGSPLFTAFLRDSSHRRQAEERASTLAHAVESTAEPIYIADLEDRFVFINRAFEKTYGYSSSEILGKTRGILFSSNNPPELLAEFLEKSRQGNWRGEILDKKKDGTEFPVFLSTSRIAGANGQVIGLLGVAQDITERKRAEQQIQLLVDAVQSTQDLVSITDFQNRFTFANRAFLEATGYREDEIIGQTPDFLYSLHNDPAVSEKALRSTRTGAWQGKVIYRRKDGTEFPIELNTAHITDSRRNLLGLVRVATDVSDRLWVERQQAALSYLAYRLNGALVPKDAAKVIFDIANELFGMDSGYVSLHSPKEDKNIIVLAIDTLDGKQTVVPPTAEKLPLTPLMRLIMTQGKRLINRSEGSSLPANPVRFGDVQRRSESMLYVPIQYSGNTLGVLSIQSYTRNKYGPDDLELLQMLADHCGNALQRIRLTEALREAEGNYRSIFETASEGIFRTSPQGSILQANPALARILGYQSPEELISSVNDLAKQVYVTADARAEFKRLLKVHGQVKGFEAENFRKDGSKIWISLNAHVKRNPNDNVTYYEGTVEDISERKRAQRHLAEVLELNQTILGASSLGILAYLATGQCIFANEAAARLFRVSIKELMGQNFRRMKSWRESGLLELAEATLQTRQIHNAERQWVGRTGEILWLDWRFAFFFSGEKAHLLVFTDDITSRKLAEEELRLLPQRIIEASEAERFRVARDLHDGVNQLIAAAKVKLARVQEKLAASSPAAGEILSRCNHLLVEALEENRRVAHNLRPSDLDEFGFIAACRNLCKEFEARTGFTVRCRIHEFASRLPANVELNLFRIVQEAFNNIEKHAQPTSVSLSIGAQKNNLVLQIRDNGRGFNPTSHQNRKGKKRGSGLTNIRERVAHLGGSWTLDSAPRRGTTITIRVHIDKVK